MQCLAGGSVDYLESHERICMKLLPDVSQQTQDVESMLVLRWSIGHRNNPLDVGHDPDHDPDPESGLRSSPGLGFGSCGGDLQSMTYCLVKYTLYHKNGTCIYVCHAYIDHLGIDGPASCFVQA